MSAQTVSIIGLSIGGVGFLVLVVEAIIQTFGYEYILYLRREEAIRGGAIWRNITLEDSGYYKDALPHIEDGETARTIRDLGKRLASVEAWQHHDGSEVADKIARRKGLIRSAGFSLSLIGILIEIYAVWISVGV